MFQGDVRSAERNDVGMGKQGAGHRFLAEPLSWAGVSKTARLEISATPYHTRACGINCRVETIRLDHHTYTTVIPVPNICENTSTGGVITVDYDVFWLEPGTFWRQGRLDLQNGAWRLWFSVLVGWLIDSKRWTTLCVNLDPALVWSHCCFRRGLVRSTEEHSKIGGDEFGCEEFVVVRNHC